VIKEWLLSWGMLGLSVLFNVFGAMVIKWKLNEAGKFELESFRGVMEYGLIFLRSPLVVSSLILFFAAPFLFGIALSRLPLLVAYPVNVGLNFLLVLLVSIVFLSESLTPTKLLAVALILVGVIILSR
jgi:quaternary ammonium compound-resistance protein SugE